MKTRNKILSAALLMSAAFLAGAAQAEQIEVPVEAALTPPRGFDDNDNVQVVLHGLLPNGCYEVGDHTTDLAGGKMKLRQFAKRRSSFICDQGGFVPEYMMMAVPFTNELTLGQLPAGNYDLEFNLAGTGTAHRGLSVSRAPVPGVDSLPYAAVTNVVAADLVPSTDSVKVNITGLLNSTCTELDQNVRVERMGDVEVVLPTIRVKEGVICTQVLRPFSVDLDLGKVAPGHRLIHVRSMSGKAFNRVVEVTR